MFKYKPRVECWLPTSNGVEDKEEMEVLLCQGMEWRPESCFWHKKTILHSFWNLLNVIAFTFYDSVYTVCISFLDPWKASHLKNWSLIWFTLLMYISFSSHWNDLIGKRTFYRNLVFLTAACCTRKDFYTPPKKMATDFCTAHQKKRRKKAGPKRREKSTP